MRFIAVLGVLFVLASCSDSDIPDNFSVACYDSSKDVTHIRFYEFDFDKNIVIKKSPPLVNTPYEVLEYSINEISAIAIIFEKTDRYGTFRFTFDRANLMLRYDFLKNNKTSNSDKSYVAKCELPQI